MELTQPSVSLLLLLRGAAQTTPTAPLARELGCERKHLVELRHPLQEHASLRLSKPAELI